jgi:hypothetical protein
LAFARNGSGFVTYPPAAKYFKVIDGLFMAQRGREGMGKRARERARLEKQEAKKLRRETLTAGSPTSNEAEVAVVMEQFRHLSEARAANEVSHDRFIEERRRMFELLDIEVPEDQ